MKRIIITGILILAAGLCLAPVLFLLVGTFMGNHEIYTCIAPALGKGDGLAIWHLLPQYPTLQNVVELLFDSPEYFQMFWNSIFYTGAILAGQMLFGMPAAWGLARYSFRGRKTVYRLFILVMMMPFQVTMLSQYLVLNRLGMLDRPQAVVLPGIFATFSVFIMWNTGKCHGGGTYGRGGRIPDFFADRHTAWKSGHPVGTGIFVFGLF